MRRVAAGFMCFALLLNGCAPFVYVGVKLLYRHADLPATQIERDIPYLPDGAHEPAHTLDLYRPATGAWPVLVFVHGGGWDSGDKQLRVGGADVYANIGRFYAARGIGVAVVNYRLQPATDWRGQVRDVGAATQWVSARIAQHGGRADAMFLMGHSAGAHLISCVALDSAELGEARVRGVISVSGAGLDLTDAQTYALGEDERYYAKRFRGADTTEAWKAIASPVKLVTSLAPPYLILYAAGEKQGLQRQAQRLQEALMGAGVEHGLTVVPGESHSRMVLVLSRADKAAAPAVLAFVQRLGQPPVQR